MKDGSRLRNSFRHTVEAMEMTAGGITQFLVNVDHANDFCQCSGQKKIDLALTLYHPSKM